MKKKTNILLTLIAVIVVLTGAAYAWFNYYGEGRNTKLISADLYLRLNDASEGIILSPIFPETIEEARSRNDNTLTFTVQGKNITNKTIYYEILLNYGDSKESPYERFNDKDLMFDLIEIVNGEEKYIVDAQSFNSIDGTKVWVDGVSANTLTDITRTYKLRMWLNEDVIISDTDPNRSYYATGEHSYKNHYASVKIAVSGDLNEKTMPLLVKTSKNYVENGKSYVMASISNGYLPEDEGKLLDTNEEIKLVITNPDNLLYLNYRDSEGNEDLTNNNESLTLTYNFNKNKTVNVQVFTTTKNDANAETSLNYKVYKNNELMEQYTNDIKVVGNNYCLNNGFNNLADCILVTENLSNSVNDAKAYIASKGAPDVSNTAPIYKYIETVEYNQNDIILYSGSIYYSSSYTFDENTGNFTLVDAKFGSIDDGTDYTGYYISLTGAYQTSPKIGKINQFEYNARGTGGFTLSNINVYDWQITNSLDSQVGLYKSNDNFGDSYIFRGNVTNNNVLFGDYKWQIIRINGDGSIRMIYNGTPTLTSAYSKYIDSAKFNNKNFGPNYVGYMYNQSDDVATSDIVTDSFFSATTSYYWADDYDVTLDDDGDKVFVLKSSNYSLALSALNDVNLSETFYTCRKSNANDTCEVLIKVNSKKTSTSASVNYLSFSPDTFEDAFKNIKDSNIKKVVDDWYNSKLLIKNNNGVNVTEYIVDNIFCNDRSMADHNGQYSITSPVNYLGKSRLSGSMMPSLICQNKNDMFSVENSHGNAKLIYPVGLITADEYVLAGGKLGLKNTNFYLNIGANYYWTMTPAQYTLIGKAYVYLINSDGMIDFYNSGGRRVSVANYVRPVINLSKDVIITSGDGTASNPYELTI